MSDSRAPIVKICGLATVEHARVAAEHGADLLGFVFAASRRQVSAATVRVIRDALDGVPIPRPPFAGVFVNPTSHELMTAVQAAGLDLVQLSGDEAPSLALDIPVPYIRAIRISATSDGEDALRQAERWMSLAHRPTWLLVDAAVPGSFGGSGQRANWQVARRLAERYPTLLAGGLDPENVAAGIAATAAMGVDVSSGVEENGSKSGERIIRFIAAARSAAPSVDVQRGVGPGIAEAAHPVQGA